MQPDAVGAAVRRLAAGGSLTREETAAAFDRVMSGEASAAQIAALLVGLRVKGESPDEVAGAAEALRRAMVPLPAPAPEELVDTCGTGGGAVGTFNISTAAALLAAGCGLRVAKHGNRSFTSQCGSADVLEALGVPIEAPVSVAAEVLERAGIVFMYAPLMHPAMRHVGPVRRELAIPTVMNVIGPLANPASAGRQVVGVADAARAPLLAGALRTLGTVHSLVVHGTGMDEVSPLAATDVLEIRGTEISAWQIEPSRHGYRGFSAESLAGGPPAQNAQLVLELLDGGGAPAPRAAVTLNAAAALYVGGVARAFDACVEVARDSLASGRGAAALERLRAGYAAATARAGPEATEGR